MNRRHGPGFPTRSLRCAGSINSASISDTGVGGMAAKVSAAHLASRWNVPTVIADGIEPGLLTRIAEGTDHPVLVFTSRGSDLDRLVGVQVWHARRCLVDDGTAVLAALDAAAALEEGIANHDGDT